MLDLLYLFLGLATFAALFGLINAVDRPERE
jgi:hypothetical protein